MDLDVVREQEQPFPPSSRWLTGLVGMQTHVVHFPTPMLRDLDKYAERLDKSMSWCLRMAWNMAASQLGEARALDSISQSRLLAGRKQPREVELPTQLWLSIALEAERLDRSRSWLLQRAWLLARPTFIGSPR